MDTVDWRDDRAGCVHVEALVLIRCGELRQHMSKREHSGFSMHYGVHTQCGKSSAALTNQVSGGCVVHLA